MRANFAFVNAFVPFADFAITISFLLSSGMAQAGRADLESKENWILVRSNPPTSSPQSSPWESQINGRAFHAVAEKIAGYELKDRSEINLVTQSGARVPVHYRLALSRNNLALQLERGSVVLDLTDCLKADATASRVFQAGYSAAWLVQDQTLSCESADEKRVIFGLGAAESVQLGNAQWTRRCALDEPTGDCKAN